MNPHDKTRAEIIARHPRFESDPSVVFAGLEEEHGWERATAIWKLACQRYDELHNG